MPEPGGNRLDLRMFGSRYVWVISLLLDLMSWQTRDTLGGPQHNPLTSGPSISRRATFPFSGGPAHW